MDRNRTARRQRLSRLGRPLFVCCLFLSFLLTCSISVQAGDLSITQVSEADAATKQEETVHLFLDIPFGISMDECEALLFERNGTGFDLRSKDDGSGSFSAISFNIHALNIGYDPTSVDFAFRDSLLYQVLVDFDSIPLDQEEGGYRSLYTNLVNHYGDPTDASLVHFGEVPNIMHYLFPEQNGEFNIEQAFSWMSSADENLGLTINFNNVALNMFKGEANQTVYTMTLEYCAKYIDTSYGERDAYPYTN